LTTTSQALSGNKKNFYGGMDEGEQLKKAKGIALRLLSLRPRSCKEVSVYLTDYGYLNDQKFAQALAVHLLENKNFGFARIGATLKERGLSPELAKATVSHLQENYSEEKTALQIMKRRFSHFNVRQATPKDKNRLVQFLRRRGFSWETISHVLMI
jgi:SOS response regulatory protein OraA/RecX